MKRITKQCPPWVTRWCRTILCDDTVRRKLAGHSILVIVNIHREIDHRTGYPQVLMLDICELDAIAASVSRLCIISIAPPVSMLIPQSSRFTQARQENTFMQRTAQRNSDGPRHRKRRHNQFEHRRPSGCATVQRPRSDDDVKKDR